MYLELSSASWALNLSSSSSIAAKSAGSEGLSRRCGVELPLATSVPAPAVPPGRPAVVLLYSERPRRLVAVTEGPPGFEDCFLLAWAKLLRAGSRIAEPSPLVPTGSHEHLQVALQETRCSLRLLPAHFKSLTNKRDP